MHIPSGGSWRTAAVLLAVVAATAVSIHGAGPPPDDAAILHVLNRVAFGPSARDVATVRELGIAAYLERQLGPERRPDDAVAARLAPLHTLGLSTSAIMETYARPLFDARRAAKQTAGDDAATPEPKGRPQREANTPLLELQQQKVIRAVYSERQLQEVLTDFWFNHFNVDARKGVDRFLLTEYERGAIRPHVLGRFRVLLGATAHSPAMLFYLDNWLSADPTRASDAPRTRRANRPVSPPQPAQAPRGLNENYGRELLELHTLGVDGGYTQHDVTDVARAFTGWTLDRPRQGSATFRFVPRLHDDGAKLVLGHRLAGGGQQDGEAVLDLLARQPATARFIASKLVRRFVADDPPAALVTRVAARFTATDGDLREVMRAILTAPEFLAPAARRAKTRTPFEFVIAALRATDAEVENAVPIVRRIQELGMPLYQCTPPTGYADSAAAWTNSGALVARMNVAQALAERPGSFGIAPLSGTGDLLVGELSPATTATIAKATTPAQRIALTLGSPEFQKR